ncbi:HXXEE domain-containing protein [Brunnivagina elsteri CCALA 953]|uniref:HXXEE domain-containing protein n=2 Tax=Brunnivagina TaxID=3344733 RepID=A0A2A2TGC5_9CYAN|nr:HXXEE domain-containing protein [Calothrix elsteri CCALA 953]
MALQNLSIWLLAIALILHTILQRSRYAIAEVWLPAYEKVKPDWRSVLFDTGLVLEIIPVFIFAFVTAFAGWQWSVLGMILPAVGLTHPLLDHLFLSWKARQLRPGTLTGLFLLFPLSIWVYYLGYTWQLLSLQAVLISGAIGLAISVWLLWETIQASQSQIS